MRTGKISENVLVRSILKRCKSKNSNVAQGPAIGQDCAIVRLGDNQEGALHVQTALAWPEGRIRHAIYSGAGNLFCSGAVPTAIAMAILLPEDCEESELRKIIDEADTACRELGVQLACGHTEVSEYVNKPQVTITSFGTADRRCSRTADIRPNLDLVMAGYPAMEGTALLARKKKEDLQQRFPLEMVEKACSFDEELSLRKASQIGWELGAVSMHDISQGGVFAALWEICESKGVGMEADLRKILIRQETIEICEIYGWNPYQLLSGGSLIMAVREGQAVADQLFAEGIPACVIGRTTEKRDKILRNGEECRYLDKPAQDEICKLDRV